MFIRNTRLAKKAKTPHKSEGSLQPIHGNTNCRVRKLYQEGLRLPFLKLYSAGELNTALWEIIKTNVRVPDLVLGDLQAQIVACDIGSREYKDMFEKYGLNTINQYSKETIDNTNKKMNW